MNDRGLARGPSRMDSEGVRWTHGPAEAVAAAHDRRGLAHRHEVKVVRKSGDNAALPGPWFAQAAAAFGI